MLQEKLFKLSSESDLYFRGINMELNTNCFRIGFNVFLFWLAVHIQKINEIN